MDKLLILKTFERLTLQATLDIDETRLFLLLLANSSNEGSNDISYLVIRDALGQEISPSKLVFICRQLIRHELIEVIFVSPDEVPRDDLTFTYKILSVGKET